MKQFYAYVHLRPNFAPFYVGKGSGNRAYDLRKKTRKNMQHQRIVEKYGQENIIIEIVLCKSENEAFLRERLAIKAFRASGVLLCNLTDGGEGASGHIPSPETRAKLSEALKGNKNTLGLIHSEETKKRMSEKSMGHPYRGVTKHSDETKRKISNKSKGNKHLLGHIHSKETRIKLSIGIKAAYSRPEVREKVSERVKRSWETRRKQGGDK